MELSRINLGNYYNAGVQNKTSFGCEHCAPSMGIEDKLPSPEKYADCSNWAVPYEKRDVLKQEYYDKVMEAITDSNGKLDQRIVDFLDNKKFDIELTDSKQKKNMTIKDAIDAAIVRTGNVDFTAFHATFVKEIGEQIIKNGFDPSKISRTKLGPGFYFSGSEGGSLEYSNCLLMAELKGNCAQVSGPFFEKIIEAGPTQSLAKFIGLKSREYELGMAENSICEKVINEYARNYLVNDLGIDMAFGPSSRFECCYAVYNPDAISNIRFRN